MFKQSLTIAAVSALLLPVIACSKNNSEVPKQTPAKAAKSVAAALPKTAIKPKPTQISSLKLETLPQGKQGALIRRGKELVMDTHRLLPDHVGNALNCTNCHLAGGTRPKAAPFVGVTDRYPKYRHRSGKTDDLQERINGCFERSMAGSKLARDSEPMAAITAYMTWLSKDVADGKNVAGTGMPRFAAPAKPDALRGAKLYTEKCTACHQAQGQGLFGANDQTLFPPLWGKRSFNIGAGMARLNTAAAFIKWNMPQGQEGSLSDQQAFDIAAYLSVQERPDFAAKSGDWPKGHKPADARY